MQMASLHQKVGALGPPAKLALGALAAIVAGGGVYFLSTYEVSLFQDASYVNTTQSKHARAYVMTSCSPA